MPKTIQEVDEKTLNALPVALVLFDQKKLYFLNKKTVEIFHIPKEILKDMLKKENLLQIFNEKQEKKLQKILKAILGGKPTYRSTWNVKNFKNENISIEANSTAVYFKKKKVVLSILYEVTDRATKEKAIQKSLREKTAQIVSIFESSSHLIWTVNKKYQITSFNQNFYNSLVALRGVNISVGCKIDKLLTKNRREYIDYWYSKYNEVFKGNKLEFERKDHKTSYRKIFLNPIYNTKNEIVEISCIAHDITESKIYEQKLINQSAKITSIFDSSSHYIWTVNKKGNYTSFNKNYFDLINSFYGIKPYVGLNMGVLKSEHAELIQQKHNETFSGKPVSFEIEISDPVGKKMFLELFLNPIYDGEKVAEVSGIAHDITEKKLVQQNIEASLKEKEVLLKEVHHRVKNNLQVISSILNLQSSYVTDENTLSILKESQNRIKTMAYIHESLYQNKSFTLVNFHEYVGTLVKNIVQSYLHSEEKIKLESNIKKIKLSIDNSIPAGLIINELVTNAIKHAFPENKRGTITLNLKCEDYVVYLEIRDNGAGFAEGINFKDSNSLGLQLVNTLIEQLEGTLDFETKKDKGTRILITFKCDYICNEDKNGKIENICC